MAKQHTVTVRMDDDIYQLLGRLAQADDRSMASMVCRLIRIEATAKGMMSGPKPVSHRIHNEA